LRFLYELSLKLGHTSPVRLLKELRPSQLGYWWALWCIEPWSEERADRRAGIVASVVANVNRDPKRTPAPFKADDFMPYLWRDPKAAAVSLSKRLLSAFGLKPKKKV